MDNNDLWQILKKIGIPTHLTCLLRNLYAGQKATVRTGYETTDLFKIGEGVQSCILSYLTYLTYIQSISYDMLAWMNHKLESSFLAEIPTISDTQTIPL